MTDKKFPSSDNPLHYGLNLNITRKDLSSSKGEFDVNMLDIEYSSEKPEDKLIEKKDEDVKSDSYYQFQNNSQGNLQIKGEHQLTEINSKLEKTQRSAKGREKMVMDNDLKCLHKEVKAMLAMNETKSPSTISHRLNVIFFIKNLKNWFCRKKYILYEKI